MAVINLEAPPQLLTGAGLGVLDPDSQSWTWDAIKSPNARVSPPEI